NDEQIQVVETARHGRKVRQGSLRGNRFELVLREFDGDPNVLEQRLQRVKAAGVPNYFGEQRFGRDRGNLQQVDDWFEERGKRPGKNLRSILLSASRSWMFNLVLAQRVADSNWNTLVDGDVLMLEGSGRQFAQDPGDDALEGRMAALDIHPSGPLPGDKGHALETERSARAIEASVLADFPNWVEKLKSLRVDADRRALRVVPRELDWDIQGKDVEVRFALPAGAYATSVVRELVEAAPLER
ncbi:MAG: tRNA pseudouridine(13) synthase TruD, partial [bacterium]